MLNGVGDFLDLLPALDKNIRPNWDKMSPNEIKRKVQKKFSFLFLKKKTDFFKKSL